MTRIKDLSKYYSVEVHPMDKDGNILEKGNYEGRSLYIHKNSFKKLCKSLKKIWRESE